MTLTRLEPEEIDSQLFSCTCQILILKMVVRLYLQRDGHQVSPKKNE
jgi:hypothetical protein